MPRIRTLKPEHRQHRKIGPLSDSQYRLWVGMICEADDEGRLVADAAHLRALIWPYHADVSAENVEKCLLFLEKSGLIRLYFVKNTRYCEFPSWGDHQVIDRKRPSLLPPSPTVRGRPRVPQHSSNDRRTLDEPSSNDRRALAADRKGSEGKGKEHPPLPPPTRGGEEVSVSNVNDGHASPSPVADFEAFWVAYPRKVAKPAAQATWVQLAVTEPLQQTILAAVAAQQRAHGPLATDPQFIPYPATWLRQHRWEDAPDPPPVEPADGPDYPPDWLVIENRWFHACEAGRRGQCVKTEYLDRVPGARQCPEHRRRPEAVANANG